MTRKQLDKKLNNVKSFLREKQELERGLICLVGNTKVIFWELLMDDYIRYIQKEAGDKNDVIFWYIFDNDFGRKKQEFDGLKIDNTRKLLNYIQMEGEIS